MKLLTVQKPHVLIIDDEKGLRIGTKRLLETEGYIAEIAENGTDGIKLASSKEFDLAIIDLKMPDMNGIDVLKEIKRVKPNTVCFIATAYASYNSAIESAKFGAYNYIPKPFTPEELLNQLKKGYENRLLILEAERLKKEKEENLLEIANEKSRSKTIINSIEEGVLVINKTGELVLFNPAVLNYLDINELFIGDEIFEILPKEINEIIKKILAAPNGKAKTYATQIDLTKNKELIIEAKCSPVLHSDKTLAGIVTVIRNITEIKKVEILKSQFVSMVAHELKAPLAAVSGFLSMILNEDLNLDENKKKEFLERSYKRLNNLNLMINDLLDISSIELNQIHREIEDVDIIELLQNVIQMLEVEIQNKKIKVDFCKKENLPLIKIDYDDIQRVFTNLLSNAIKYNKEFGNIDISVEQKGTFIIIKISDSGIGMKPKELKNIFNEFYRAKNEYTKSVNGTGLGLSIVKRIIDNYSGKIEVTSEYNLGSEFTIYLPVK